MPRAGPGLDMSPTSSTAPGASSSPTRSLHGQINDDKSGNTSREDRGGDDQHDTEAQNVHLEPALSASDATAQAEMAMATGAVVESSDATATQSDERAEDELVRNEGEIHMDGGWTAWMQVAASAACYFNHLGLLNSYGVFQTYYETHLLRTSSPSAISWIGSVQVFFLMAVSVIMGPIYDAGHARGLLIAGTALLVAGFMFASVSTVYWQMLLSQGVCMGLGACALSVPSIAIVPMYFKKRRARAMSLATVGSGLGATIYPLVFQSLLGSVGFGWTMRIMGFIALAMCSFAIITIRPIPVSRLSSPRREGFSWRFFIDVTAFSDTPFILYCVAIFFENLTYFVPPYYLQSYARTHGMQGHGKLVNYLLAIQNAASLPGRVAPSFVADKIGSLDTFIGVLGFTSATNFYWISVSNPAGNISFAVLYGFFAGGVLSLLSVVLTRVTPDLRRLGTRLGMVSILKGVASLIGPPISGALLDATGSFLGVQLFSALGMMLTAIFIIVLRVYEMRKKMKAAQKKEDELPGVDISMEEHPTRE